jgi:hypothetical protein
MLRKESERSSKTQKATKPGNTAETLRKGNKQTIETQTRE